MKKTTERGKALIEPDAARVGQAPVDVFLIPGTWAAGVKETLLARQVPPAPDWTQADSALVRALRTDLEGANVFTLRWRGRNRESDRIEGARVLRAALLSSPAEQKVIIAHSHGGNIAVDAAKVGEDSPIKGLAVVTLNTPFFEDLRRNSGRLYGAFLLWFLAGGTWLSVLPASGRVAPAIVWILLLCLAPLAVRRVHAGHDARPPTDLGDTPFLCLNAYEDEAFGALNVAEAIGNIPFLLVGKWSLWIFWFVATLVLLLPVDLGPVSERPFEFGLPVAIGGSLSLFAALVVVLVAAFLALKQTSPAKAYPPTFLLLAVILASPWWLAWVGERPQYLFVHLAAGIAWAGVGFFALGILMMLLNLVVRGVFQGMWNPLEPFIVRQVVSLTPLSATRVKFRELEPLAPQSLNHSMLHERGDAVWEREILPFLRPVA